MFSVYEKSGNMLGFIYYADVIITALVIKKSYINLPVEQTVRSHTFKQFPLVFRYAKHRLVAGHHPVVFYGKSGIGLAFAVERKSNVNGLFVESFSGKAQIKQFSTAR